MAASVRRPVEGKRRQSNVGLLVAGEGGGGASILFRVYKPFQTTANATNYTNPYPSASLCYAALPLALLACSIAILHTTIPITLHLHQLLHSFCSHLLLLCSAIACVLPLLFSCLLS